MTNKFYYKDGSILDYRDYDKILHREDGPAVEFANGDKAWYINDKLHRENGPAVEFANGDKYWYINDKRHREDGPAIERADRGKSWWLNDIQYNKKDFEAKLKEVDNLPTIAKLTHPEEWIRKRVKNDQ